MNTTSNDVLAASLRQEIDRLWVVLEHMSSADEHRLAAQRFREQADVAEANANFIRAELHSTIKQMHEEVTKYLNAVAVVGYAAYFATWSFSKDIIGKELSALVALLGMISVSFFVLWEIWLAFSVRLKGINDITNVLRNLVAHDDFEGLKHELQGNEARRIAIATPIHRLVFAVSASAAVVGGAIMMQALYMKI